MRMRPALLGCSSVLAVLGVLVPDRAAFAQGQPTQSELPTSQASTGVELEEITVTARKRDERLSEVPLSISAFSGDALAAQATRDFTQLADRLPQLLVSTGSGAAGGTVSLRGIGSGSFNANIDQAVSTNIDGIQISKALVIQQGFFDLAQAEILKGPQALFFGKNSPGGVISLKTANPGDTFEMIGRVAYGFDERKAVIEGVLSGPLGGGFGARAAVQYAYGDGFYRNNSLSVGPGQGRLSKPREFIGRLTLTYDSDGPFTAVLKYSHADTRSNGRGTQQRFVCSPQNLFRQSGIQAQQTECVANRSIASPTATQTYAAALPGINPSDGKPFDDQKSNLLSLEANYQAGSLKLTSVSGYYHTRSSFFITATGDFGTRPNTSTSMFVGSANGQKYRAFSQELRLASQWDGPLQFLAGGYFQHERNQVRNSAVLDATGVLTSLGLGPLFGGTVPPGLAITTILPSQNTAKSKSYSVFGQLQYDLLPTLNLSVGGRYTHEDKSLDKVQVNVPGAFGGAPPFGSVVGGGTFLAANNPLLNAKFNDFSPEVTLAFKPGAGQTYYVSYKQGFKSGGYDTSVLLPTGIADLAPYRPERAEGVEGGAKFVLNDGRLRLNLGAYYYRYTDLQTSVFFPPTTLRTANAERATVKGLEADLTWAPAMIDGLTLSAAVNYNRGRYGKFLTNCFDAQASTAGCSLQFVQSANNGLGGFTIQDLAGQQIVNAPDWTGSVGLDYVRPVVGEWTAGFNLNLNIVGRYQPHDSYDPRAVQKSAARLNAGVRVMSPNDRFELALIGRNLTNEVRATFVQSPPLESVGRGTPFANPSDLLGIFTPPRSVVMQVSVKY
jgi:iron complex outermembrane receptor protein